MPDAPPRLNNTNRKIILLFVLYWVRAQMEVEISSQALRQLYLALQ
jgi:hypothetical protein